MEHTDTVNLLKECDAGTKMAVASIDEVLDQVSNPRMKDMLEESKRHHTSLGNEIHTMLLTAGSKEKEPAALAKGMSFLKTNMKLAMEHSDATIADLMTDGCNMGVKSLYRYKNQYSAASRHSMDLCQEIASIEEDLCRKLRDFL